MGTASVRLEDLAAAVGHAAPSLDEAGQRIGLEVYRQLARGAPAPVAGIASGTGVAVEEVERLLGAWPGVFRDPQGNVLGFWGLTIARLTPTHRLEVQGKELFAWCAWDTLFLPGVLDATARVESACPVTGEAIWLVVAPERIQEASHPQAVVSFLLPDRDFDAEVIQRFCHFVHFFASQEAGDAWTAGHPGTFLLSLGDAFELGRRWNALRFPSHREVGR